MPSVRGQLNEGARLDHTPPVALCTALYVCGKLGYGNSPLLVTLFHYDAHSVYQEISVSRVSWLSYNMVTKFSNCRGVHGWHLLFTEGSNER